jgi:hypothetical protein
MKHIESIKNIVDKDSFVKYEYDLIKQIINKGEKIE